MMQPDHTNKNIALKKEEVADSAKVPPACGPSSSPRGGTRRHGTNCVGFRIDLMVNAVEECLQDERINVDAYIDIYSEFRRAFEAAGTVYSFVSSEIYGKLDILRKFRQGEDADRYLTVESMLQDLRDRPDQTQPNAARTLLRLHRGVPFLAGTFRTLATTDREDRMGVHGRQVYKSTLAKHHPKLVRQTIIAVLLLSPTNNFMIKRLVGIDPATQDHFLKTLPVLCDRLNDLFEATEEIYAKYDMLDLP